MSLHRWSSALIVTLSFRITISIGIIPCHEPLAALAGQIPLTGEIAVRVVIGGKLGHNPT